MSYVYRRRYCATPAERFRMDARNFVRKSFKPIMTYIAEGIVASVYFSIFIFFLPAIAAAFR